MSERPIVAKRFQNRLDAIIKRSGDFQAKFQDNESIYSLLSKFVEFSKDYVRLLKQVPPEISRNPFVINRGIENLLQEWNVLSRASEQRLIEGMKNEIEEASMLAQAYCDQWNALLPGNSFHKLETPVVYFEKIFRISRSIYAPQIPVISIPLTDYNQSDNWQGLAHEFSHHIFWNGFDAEQTSSTHQNLSKSISMKLFSPKADSVFFAKSQYWRQQADRVALWENWMEEVFADVYGTLLAGPKYALSAQDRMAELVNRVEDFLVADHEHPCVYLRPLISLYTFEAIVDQTQSGEDVLKSLKNRWTEFSKNASELKYKTFPLEVLAEDARTVVKIILDGEYWPIQYNPIKMLTSPIQEEPTFSLLENVIDLDPQTLVFTGLDKIKLPTTFEGVKQFLMDSSARIINQWGSKRVEEDTKLLAWLSLTGLELSETKGYPVHGCTDDHNHLWGFWYGKHTHSQDGSDVLSC